MSQFIAAIKCRPLCWEKTIKALCNVRRANNVPMHPDCVDSAIGPAISCSRCPYVCFTPTQLAGHNFREHGIIAEARWYLDESNMCPSCLRRFPTRTQALKHMAASKRCAGFDQFAVALPGLTVHTLDAAEQLRIRSRASDGAHDSCQLSHLQTCQGPLRKQHELCFKSRPRYKLEEPPFTACQADYYAPCSCRCILCMGEGVA